MESACHLSGSNQASGTGTAGAPAIYTTAHVSLKRFIGNIHTATSQNLGVAAVAQM